LSTSWPPTATPAPLSDTSPPAWPRAWPRRRSASSWAARSRPSGRRAGRDRAREVMQKCSTVGHEADECRRGGFVTMRLQGPAKRLPVFIGESDHSRHKPLYAEIVHRAHAAGLAGASVMRGIEGFGASQHVHTTR